MCTGWSRQRWKEPRTPKCRTGYLRDPGGGLPTPGSLAVFGSITPKLIASSHYFPTTAFGGADAPYPTFLFQVSYLLFHCSLGNPETVCNHSSGQLWVGLQQPQNFLRTFLRTSTSTETKLHRTFHLFSANSGSRAQSGLGRSSPSSGMMPVMLSPSKPSAALLSEAVFLSAAGGFMWNSHFDQTIGYQRSEDLFPELGAVSTPGNSH